ncbi:unnamed protein product [Caenorhabditis auriculariae]|uniref:Uncharacterized protein n=1 Tax=Caenorhabditis auriculariae TaxID=2777116 RepID=A0A8S1HXA3_9PELO|nr:unnamed protein product [Caenorhabditis auriculariae]
MDATPNNTTELWAVGDLVVRREGLAVEVFHQASDAQFRRTATQTERVSEMAMDRELAERQRRVRLLMDTLLARTQLGGPYVETRERGVQAADKAEEEKEKGEVGTSQKRKGRKREASGGRDGRERKPDVLTVHYSRRCFFGTFFTGKDP